MAKNDILERARQVLEVNDRGQWTSPSVNVYPHQWLWDSCFISMGLAHLDVKRAEQELTSLLRGQWRNGMLPHMIFAPGRMGSRHLPRIWESRLSPYAPEGVNTSGITQPPMLAQAVHYLGEQMEVTARKQLYKRFLPHLVAYHNWLYEERDPHGTGLVVLIHPWETGMDDTPAWIEAMHARQKPFWIKLIEWGRLDKLVETLRRSSQQIAIEERASAIESLMLYQITKRLKRKAYDSEAIMHHSHFLIEDLFFNCILVRANALLVTMAKEAGVKLPAQLMSSMNQATKALEALWDSNKEMYYSRYFTSRKLIDEPSLAALLPLYAGVIKPKRAAKLVELLKRRDMFAANFPVPTVPLSSPYFHHRRYWQGPVWLNTNWLIYDGLRRYGFDEQADSLRERSLELVERSGFHEYFSPIDGLGAGADPFSWTAAMTIVFADSAAKE